MTALIVALDIFLAISGCAGGLGLIRDPTGSALHLPLKWLSHVPLVKDYKWPGIFLVVAYAMGGSLAAIGTANHYPWAQEFNMFLGLILMAWIIVELVYIPKKHFIQLIYFLLGVALVILPLL